MKTAPSTKRPSAANAPTPDALLKKLGLSADNPGVFCGEWLGSGKPLKSVSPIDGTRAGRRAHGHGRRI